MYALASPYEYYGSTLCVRGPFLWDESGLISFSSYKNLTVRGHLNVVKDGKGKGNYALIEFKSMRADIKEAVERIEKPENASFNYLKKYIKPDNMAISFFATYVKSTGAFYKIKEQQILATNAILLNACREFERMNIGKKKKTAIWQMLSKSINELEGFEHSLPKSDRRLKTAFDKYNQREGNNYKSLIHGGEGNINSKKRTEMIEDLVLSIYSMKNKPFATTVQQLYMQFLGGALDIVDSSTGELFQVEDFYKDGKPIILSDGTIWNIINDLENRKLVDKYRSGSLEHNNKHRPHHHRSAPIYSLSKVSLDDRDLPRKMLDGQRVKAYYAYDVASGCVIGASYSRDKDSKLFLDCIRDMLMFLNDNDFGIPMEMEVEHHLVNLFKNDLMKAGTAFPFVRWCNAGNSQEKHAEHFNKAKKYGYEKRYQDGIGRWYAKSEAHRTIVEKVFDSENNNYKEKKYEYNSLIADDRETVQQYNHDLHPNQKRYKGMTRMDVLKSTLNPNLTKFDDVIWARYVGDKASVTIKRSQYVRVQYADYQLPSHRVMRQLAPNNLSVEAYYLRDKQGEIKSVYLYQDDQFICECEKIVKYNTATAEHTEADRLSITNQSKYVSEFDSDIKKAKSRISKLVLLENKYPTEVKPEIIQIEPLSEKEEDEFEKLIASNDSDFIREKAKYNI